MTWSAVLHEEIYSHFPGRSPESISVLDVGTGPGFFAILLAESGFHVTAVDMTPEMLDEALLRPGRCFVNYEFKALSKDKSAKLLESLGHKVDVQKDMTLAEIYNYKEEEVPKTIPRKIGF